MPFEARATGDTPTRQIGGWPGFFFFRFHMHDARIDQLGFAKELDRHFTEPLNGEVKQALLARSIDRATGDHFEAVLVTPTETTVDADKFLKLYEKKAISRAQFLAAIAIRKKQALIAVSGDDLAKISVVEPGSPRLSVPRIKGFEPTLADCIASLAAAIAGR